MVFLVLYPTDLQFSETGTNTKTLRSSELFYPMVDVAEESMLSEHDSQFSFQKIPIDNLLVDYWIRKQVSEMNYILLSNIGIVSSKEHRFFIKGFESENQYYLIRNFQLLLQKSVSKVIELAQEIMPDREFTLEISFRNLMNLKFEKNSRGVCEVDTVDIPAIEISSLEDSARYMRELYDKLIFHIKAS